MKKYRGMVYLIGAGPGDPGLITVKGMECIKQADVIVYDRLASTRLLDHRRPDAKCIFVGKKPNKHTMSQNEINKLLVDKAKSGLTVARLKGGDPFVFGRGGEEAEELALNNISFEIVPGVTSAVAVPAYAGIPVTHRGYTSSVSIITGNEDPSKDNSNIDWPQLGSSRGTLVFLMGMSNLEAIADKLVANGRPPDTPVALIRWGTHPEQQTLVGTLNNITTMATKSNFRNPAIIIVGEVVNLREKLRWFEERPLFGKKILVTRSREQASVLSQSIERLGGTPVEFPAISITPPMNYSALDKAISNISSYQWIIFTSVNGVKFFLRRLRELNKDIRELKGVRICAIGPQTRKELDSIALQVDYVPAEYRAEEIINGLRDKIVDGDRILLPRADIARRVLHESLSELGALVDEVTAYCTVTGSGNAHTIKEMLSNGNIDIITFTSSSTVKNFVSMLGADNPAKLLGETIIACIGPITAKTANEFGITCHVMAGEYTIDGLVKAIINYAAPQRDS